MPILDSTASRTAISEELGCNTCVRVLRIPFTCFRSYSLFGSFSGAEGAVRGLTNALLGRKSRERGARVVGQSTRIPVRMHQVSVFILRDTKNGALVELRELPRPLVNPGVRLRRLNIWVSASPRA